MDRRRRLRPAIALIVTVVAIATTIATSGGRGASAGPDGRVDVVASFFPLADAVTRIGGRHVAVRNLTPPSCLGAYHDMLLQQARESDAAIDQLLAAVSAVDTPAMGRAATRFDAARTMLENAPRILVSAPPTC